MRHVSVMVRLGSAEASENGLFEIISALEAWGIEFTVSVPFERFAELKGRIEGRRRWRRLDREVSYFETAWKPKVWDQRFRFVFVRTRTKKQQKGPVQLDLFVPYEYGNAFKVIVTNKALKAKKLVMFHEGRGSQEGIFAELKSQCQMGYVPARTCVGNQLYLLAGLFAHNLTRELQMATTARSRNTTAKRAALWVFEELNTFRNVFLRRAGRLTWPQGRLTLTVSAAERIKRRFLQRLAALQTALTV